MLQPKMPGSIQNQANPAKNGDVALGDTLERSAVCDNGWSKVSCEVNESKVIGYIQNQMLSDTDQIQPADKDVEVKSDATVLDYPSRKDGEEVGKFFSWMK